MNDEICPCKAGCKWCLEGDDFACKSSRNWRMFLSVALGTPMPLTSKGEKILKNMIRQYGSKHKGEQVFYSAANAKKITGVHESRRHYIRAAEALRRQMFPHLAQPRR
jgi:hypothetical protein